jgi:hypothetical protein
VNAVDPQTRLVIYCGDADLKHLGGVWWQDKNSGYIFAAQQATCKGDLKSIAQSLFPQHDLNAVGMDQYRKIVLCHDALIDMPTYDEPYITKSLFEAGYALPPSILRIWSGSRYLLPCCMNFFIAHGTDRVSNAF